MQLPICTIGQHTMFDCTLLTYKPQLTVSCVVYLFFTLDASEIVSLVDSIREDPKRLDFVDALVLKVMHLSEVSGGSELSMDTFQMEHLPKQAYLQVLQSTLTALHRVGFSALPSSNADFPQDNMTELANILSRDNQYIVDLTHALRGIDDNRTDIFLDDVPSNMGDYQQADGPPHLVENKLQNVQKNRIPQLNLSDDMLSIDTRDQHRNEISKEEGKWTLLTIGASTGMLLS